MRAALHQIEGLGSNLAANAFTSVIAGAEFSRVNAAQQRIQQIAELITDPILQRISELDAVRPFAADADSIDTLIS